MGGTRQEGEHGEEERVTDQERAILMELWWVLVTFHDVGTHQMGAMTNSTAVNPASRGPRFSEPVPGSTQASQMTIGTTHTMWWTQVMGEDEQAHRRYTSSRASSTTGDVPTPRRAPAIRRHRVTITAGMSTTAETGPWWNLCRTLDKFWSLA